MYYKTTINHPLKFQRELKIESRCWENNGNAQEEIKSREFTQEESEFIRAEVIDSATCMLTGERNELYTHLTRINNKLVDFYMCAEYETVLDFIEEIVLTEEKDYFRFSDLFLQILIEGSLAELLVASSDLLNSWSLSKNKDRIGKIYQKDNLCILLNILSSPEIRFLKYDNNGETQLNPNDLSKENKFKIRNNICSALIAVVSNETIELDVVPIIINQIPELIDNIMRCKSLVIECVFNLLYTLIVKTPDLFDDDIADKIFESITSYFKSSIQPFGFRAFLKLCTLKKEIGVKYLNNLDAINKSMYRDNKILEDSLKMLLEMLSSKNNDVFYKTINYLRCYEFLDFLLEYREIDNLFLIFIYQAYQTNSSIDTERSTQFLRLLMSKRIFNMIFYMASESAEDSMAPYEVRNISIVLLSIFLTDYLMPNENYYLSYLTIANNFILDCYDYGFDYILCCIYTIISIPDLIKNQKIFEKLNTLIIPSLNQALKTQDFSQYSEKINSILQKFASYN